MNLSRTARTACTAASLLCLALASTALAAPAKKSVRKAPAPAKNRKAGATQIKAVEGPILTTAFNNGAVQVKFSNLRRALAWKDEPAGPGFYYILVDFDAGNVTKHDVNVMMDTKAADDKGRQSDQYETTSYSLVPASHASDTISVVVPEDLNPTKLLIRFQFELGDPFRATFPKDFKWNEFQNAGKAGDQLNNGMIGLTATLEDNAKGSDAPEEGNRFVAVSGKVSLLTKKERQVEFQNVKLRTADGQVFEPAEWKSGEDGTLAPNGSRSYRVLFQVPNDAQPKEFEMDSGYMDDTPIKVTF